MKLFQFLIEKIKGIAIEKQGNFKSKEVVVINGKEV